MEHTTESPVCSITALGTFDESLRTAVCLTRAVARVYDPATDETLGHVCLTHLAGTPGNLVLLDGVSVQDVRGNY